MKSWSSSSLAPLAMVRLINAICSGSYVRSRMGRGSDSASVSGDAIEQPPRPPPPPGMARTWGATEMLGELIAGNLEAAGHQAAGRGPRLTDGPSESSAKKLA